MVIAETDQSASSAFPGEERERSLVTLDPTTVGAGYLSSRVASCAPNSRPDSDNTNTSSNSGGERLCAVMGMSSEFAIGNTDSGLLQQTSARSSLNGNCEEEVEMLSCPQCDGLFRGREEVFRHMKERHQQHSSLAAHRKIRCDECQRSFKSMVNILI